MNIRYNQIFFYKKKRYNQTNPSNIYFKMDITREREGKISFIGLHDFLGIGF